MVQHKGRFSRQCGVTASCRCCTSLVVPLLLQCWHGLLCQVCNTGLTTCTMRA